MTFKDYLDYFEKLINQHPSERTPPYDDAEYAEYTKLNWSRLNRWLKTGKINDEMMAVLSGIESPQNWIVITEPWCGDAAHIVPFIELISRQNPLITVEYELRDSAPFRINEYLTNNTKSIPKLIIRNNKGEDLAVWGPRPEACQKVYLDLKEKGEAMEQIKLEIQNWYNENKGAEIQREIRQVIEMIPA